MVDGPEVARSARLDGAVRVALLVDRLDGGTGGYTRRLAGGLAASGVDVGIWAVRPGPAPVPVHRLWVPWGHGAAARWASALTWRAHRLDVDVVHALGRFPGAPIYRAGGGVHDSWIAARDGVRSWRDRVEGRIDAATARAAAVVVCNSEKVRDEVAALGVPPARLRVIRSGVDLARFRPDPEARRDARHAWRVPDRGRVVLFLGHGFARKGLDVAFAAFARVAGPDDRFVVAGADRDAARYRAKIAASLGQRLVWLGPVDDAARWLPGADATLLPTRYDAAANTTLEALSCDVPAITSGQDGNSEIVPDGLRVADPDDEVGFAAAIDAAWSGAYLGRCREAASAWPAIRNAAETKRVYQEWLDGEG